MASKLERLINRWAADVVHAPPSSLKEIYDSAREDVGGGHDLDAPSTAIVQCLLRHVFAETISEVRPSLEDMVAPHANLCCTRVSLIA